ncbi:hypothetical protein ACLB2K_037655 [Fragaria x ananassa]
MEQWKEFFSTAPNKSTVFDILDHAIAVAASDFPDEFSRLKTRLLNSIQAAGSGGKSETGSDPRPSLIVRIKIPPKLAEPASCVVETSSSIKAKPCLDEEAKLQATKRKLHDRYEEIENTKRQKRIQVAIPAKKAARKHCMPGRKPLGFQSLHSRLVIKYK